jgi:hypothetical protein
VSAPCCPIQPAFDGRQGDTEMVTSSTTAVAELDMRRAVAASRRLVRLGLHARRVLVATVAVAAGFMSTCGPAVAQDAPRIDPIFSYQMSVADPAGERVFDIRGAQKEPEDTTPPFVSTATMLVRQSCVRRTTGWASSSRRSRGASRRLRTGCDCVADDSTVSPGSAPSPAYHVAVSGRCGCGSRSAARTC